MERVEAHERSRYALRSAWAAALSVTCGLLPVFLVGGLAPFIAVDLDFGPRVLGYTVGAFFALSALASWQAGRLSSAHRPADVLTWASVLQAVTAVVAAALAFHWSHLLLWVSLAGLVNGAVQPAANLILLQHRGPERLGRALGLKQSATPLASILVGAAIPAVALTVGWRWAIGLPIAVALMLFAVIPRAGTVTTRVEGRAPTRALVDRVAVALLALGAGCAAGAGVAATSFLVTTATVREIPAATAGTILSATGIVNVVVLVASGWYADRYGSSRRSRPLAWLLAVGVVGYILVASADATVFLVIGAIIAVGFGWGWHVFLHLSALSGGFGAAGKITGAVMAGVFTGCLLVPVLFGVVAEAFSNRAGWWVLTATATVGVTAFVLSASQERVS